MNPTNIVSTAQVAIINNILTSIFTAVIDFLYSVVSVLVDFFTQPAVLGALVTIAIVYGAYRMLKRKSTSL